MNIRNLLLLLLTAALFAGCATAPRFADTSGKWDWLCCGGEYSGTIELQQFADGKISGRMWEATGGVPGKLSGSIKGNYMEFTRTWGHAEQHYTLALSTNGKTLIGSLDGIRDKSVGTDFEAKKK